MVSRTCADATLIVMYYILESNPHPFYSFRGLKNQMQIIILCGLDSWSRAGFWKNDRAAVRAVRTIQYNNLLFYLLLIIIIYYSSDLPSLLITESLFVLSTQSLSSYLQHCPPIQCHLRIRSEHCLCNTS